MKQTRVQLAGALIAVALAAGGCVSKGEFEKAQAEKSQEIDALQKERAALEQQTRELQSQRKALEEQKVALERQQGNLRTELDTLARQKAQLEAANQQTKSQYDGLVANLNEEVKKGQLQVRQYKDMLTVEVAEQLFFDSGRAALKEQGKDVLKRVGEALKGYEDKVIRVVGHTDNVPIATATARSKKLLAEGLIPKSLKVQLFKSLLDSNASENGARMTAMDKATENAGELLKQLRLTYNRTRQAAITKEILEIVGGAEALKSA